jgi:hypothetical protein
MEAVRAVMRLAGYTILVTNCIIIIYMVADWAKENFGGSQNDR